MAYKLIVSDMDGTLLTSNGKISEETEKVLRQLMDKGIHVAVATGRIFTSAKVYAKYLGVTTPIIACNGAMVRNLKDMKIIYESHLSREDCLKILEICRKHHLYFHFYTDTIFYTERLDYSSLKYSEWNKTLREEEKIDLRVIDDPYKIIQNNESKIYKFVIIDQDKELLAKVRRELEAIPTIECSKSWHNNLEIMNRGVSKGAAVRRLAKSLGIRREEVICFGDHENDLSMIEYAGLGIAMGNADEVVKARADYVTATNDEDGVAKALKKFVLLDSGRERKIR
ncbi:Cof-type HAD-IIB family hydrolase [Thermotalea metallivorans]|uniref:Sugar phosphatase YidA n=1 Tax=Thermotalea metallivorans TaxID=520762 RepID=A0A140L0D4_9FIRM|nr:Cof-type HAD-IIB family hydrolase [Thermotalea metallivorans]KXG74009.1 Sugar phosphatase YidA [Thermotalea metallivorans]